MSEDLLFEIRCEELPSGLVGPLGQSLAVSLMDIFSKEGLTYQEVYYFSSPRRIAVLVRALSSEQPSKKILRRGPSVQAAYDKEGKPTKALEGFLRASGASLETIQTQETDKGTWIIYECMEQGIQTIELLPELIEKALKALVIPKPMRWGNHDYTFARPVHGCVLMYGEKIIDTNFFGKKTSNVTFGHRFLSTQPIHIAVPAAYETLLKSHFVIPNFEERKALIRTQIENLVRPLAYDAIIPVELLNEVTSIVEWPVALLCQFEPEFLNVPPEALMMAMQTHQKAFPLQDKKGQLVPYFVTVANIESNDAPRIVAGNEKVMRARLSDAKFFYDTDKKKSLVQYREETKKVAFQAGLGSLFNKTERVEQLVLDIEELFDLERDIAVEAARFSKSDLMTGMVNEFPDLQGIMGYYYAIAEGKDERLAKALEEQYLPRFAKDKLPHSHLGLALSLADRIDSLVGIFALGKRPTGDKDPFKLRRYAQAIVRILMTTPVELSLTQLFSLSRKSYKNLIAIPESLELELKLFLLDRLEAYYKDLGIPTHWILAVRHRQNEYLYDFDMRIKALNRFIELPEATLLAAACKRVNHILDNIKTNELAVQLDLFTLPAEEALYESIHTVQQKIAAFQANKNYEKTLLELAQLSPFIDTFFNDVLVMAEDEKVRQNRLALLYELQKLLLSVVDLSEL